MSVAILVPVLRRPHRVKPLLDSIAAATPTPYRVLFLCDPNDAAELRAVRATDADFLDCGGKYSAKINLGVRLTQEPLIFLGADDLEFHPGWLEAAAGRLTDTIGVVGTNDLGNRRVIAGEHATHSLVARWYAELGTIDRSDWLLHEGYDHNFVDNEFVETAKSRHAWAFARDSIVEHLHPLWGKGEPDEIYDKGMAHFRADRRHFVHRVPLWT
jgi:hypothetical protein